MAVVTVTVNIDGTLMDPKIILLHVDVVREMNRIPTAEIELLEPAIFEKGFQISDKGTFAPGKKVEIKIRYEGKNKTEFKVFEGIIVRLEVSATTRQSTYKICLRDVTFQMTTNRKSAYFEKKSDSAIIKEILGTYPKVTPGKIFATQPVHKEMVQFYSSDWDFMMARAEANGLLVVVNDGKVDLIDASIKGSAKHSFFLSTALISNLEIESDLRNQYKTVTAQGWDVKKGELSARAQAKEVKLAPGKISPTAGAADIGTNEYHLRSIVPTEKEELEAWAQSQMVKSRGSLVQGTITVPGMGDILPGETMELKEIAKAFDGMTMVTGVRHQVSTSGWETTIQFGLGYNWIYHREDFMDRPAGGMLPGVNGLQIGIVDEFKEDTDSPLTRVKVKIPSIDGQKASVWARLATFDAGKERGAFFRPYPGDEVVLGFFNDDPRQPVILGSVYNKLNAHTLKPEKENPKRGFYTKEGLSILFDDKEKSILIETKARQSILINESKPSIVITDKKNSNTVTLDDKGITLKAEKSDILIDSGGDLTLKAKGKVILDAPGVETK
ncbi:MAG: type VI secretion system tip protein VgrG [Bacteroidia bacterium]|nr:type VI secretion system tip protein VgrG [Bacteroidia bacterium]